MSKKETSDDNSKQLNAHLDYLKLSFTKGNYSQFAADAAKEGISYIDFLSQLIAGEARLREDNSAARRVRMARFPVTKTLDQFNWNWPRKINRLQIQNLFGLQFIRDKANAIFLGGVGLGKTHLSIAIGHQAAISGHSVLFSTAIDTVNSLSAAKNAGSLKQELKRYLRPDLLIVDELGYLPIDKQGADLLFQVLSQRYERGSIIITSNRAYKHWSEIFNNDATLTSALLDRLLHFADTVKIEGKSFRHPEDTE